MKPIWTVLAAGLIAGVSGCSNLHHSLMFRPATERATVARGEADNGPPDLFYHPPETPTERLARFFPGLTRSQKPAPPASEGTLRGAGNPDLRAVPRDAAPDGETATAAGRPRSNRPATGRRPEVAARPREPIPRPESESLPVLAAAVVAETDPADSPRAALALPELTPAQQALRAARVAEMTSPGIRSVRRMPPVPAVHPAASREAPALAASPASRPAVHQEDDQARQARTEVEVDPFPAESKPAAVTAAEPASADMRSLAPPVEPPNPKPAAEPAVERPREVVAKLPIGEDDPPKVQPAAETEASGPPAIQTPATEPAERRETRSAPVQTQAVVDPDTGGDRTLAGRPRQVQAQPIRDYLPPDLPPVSFPRTYYTSRELAKVTDRPKVDPETKPARWTWTPKLFRRLHKEAAPVVKPETVPLGMDAR